MNSTRKIFKTAAKRNPSPAAAPYHPRSMPDPRSMSDAQSMPAFPLREPVDAQVAEAIRMRQTQLLLYYVVATRAR